jgi:acyl-CoA reductase-like NAD-dependent aldehyde dehydrogenase
MHAPLTGAQWPVRQRMAWLARLRAHLVAHERELTSAITQDTLKPGWQALTGDVLTLLHACNWHLRHAPRALAPRAVGRALTFLPATGARVHREPLGTVAIIATWNYPVQLLGIQLVQALVAGNRVIVKPSERAPRSQGLLLHLARSAGLPEGYLRALPATREAGQQLLDDHEHGRERIDHVVFTGSTRVGRQIAQWCARHLVTSTLELSGQDSAIVRADADVALAARCIWAGFTLNAGQTCLAPKRVLVHNTAHDALVEHLARLARAHEAHETQRPIEPAVVERMQHEAAGALSSGARELVPFNPARPHAPRVLLDVPGAHPLASCATDDVLFAPLLIIQRVADDAETLAQHHRCGQHLMTSIFTRDLAAAHALAPCLGAGVVTINDCVLPGGHPGVAITGRGPSGWGPSRGLEGLLALTRAVTITHTRGWPRPPLGPIGDKQLNQLRSGLRWLFGKPVRATPPR